MPYLKEQITGRIMRRRGPWMEKINQGKILKEKYERKFTNAWISNISEESVQKFSKSYMDFLTHSKTEREAVESAEVEAKKRGFIPLSEKSGDKLNPGDRVYCVNRDKNILFAVIGTNPSESGFNIIGSHVDSPRIDLKPNPLYQDSEMVLLKTHYYGGIKKYQWATIPLSIHGVIFRENGEKVSIRLGENEDDPCFCFTDLLPHLAHEQMEKKMKDAITAEELNLLFGSRPFPEENLEDSIKLNVFDLLSKTYGITEKDFARSELEIVPAFHAREVGIDRSMIGAYGQDDKICAYTSLQSILGLQMPARTALCFLVDKEEIGSEGNTGMQSAFLENTIARLCAMTTDHYTEFTFRNTLFKSKFLSADVTDVVDPTYEGVDDKRNSAFLGNGIVITKYTGSDGKGGANDANAEFVSEIANLFDRNHIVWQTGEMGKVDAGGGGTIAKYLARTGMDVLDVGPGILSMHSPFEVSSKIDLYTSYLAYQTFYSLS